MNAPTDEERRLHEESLAGHREKLDADFRALVGPRVAGAVFAMLEGIRVARAVLRHPIDAARYVRQNWRRR